MLKTTFQKYAGIIGLLIAVLCWAPAPVITKLALNQVPTFAFAFLSRFLALIILFIFFFHKGAFKVNTKDLPTLILAGLTGSVLNIGLFLFGIERTNAMDAQAIFSVGPLINTIFAYFILKEKIHSTQTIGVIIGFIGAVLIATKLYFETGNLQSGDLFGNLLIFLASVSWVFYILLSKKLSQKYSPTTITSYSFLVGAVAFFPVALLESGGNIGRIFNVSGVGLFGVLYQGVFASVIAFLTYQVGLKLTSAFAAGVVLYLNPIGTTLIAMIVLSEKLTLPFIVGTAFIIIGSLVATQYLSVKTHLSRLFGKSSQADLFEEIQTKD